MTYKAVLVSGVLGLLAAGCDELGQPITLGTKGRVGPTVSATGGSAGTGPGGSSGAATTAVTPGTGAATGTSALAGIWFGNVRTDHPDFYGPPIDQLTIEIDENGRLKYCGFTEFGYQASFGAPPDEIPLGGSAIAHVIQGAGFFLRFSVVSADWQSDHFAFTYSSHSDGLNTGETPETPYTDLTVALTGTLVDGKLHVHWTEVGSQYTASLQAVAEGDLSR